MPITLDSIRKVYGHVVAVEDVSLRIDKGQFHCLIGPNGSGKTTLFHLILGLTRPTSGRVTVSGGTIGCGFQRPNFYPDLTVRENLDVFSRLVGMRDDEWRETLLDELRLRRVRDRRAADLSGGFTRKLDLALALLKRPQFLLLDEPLGALDDVSVERLLPFLASYASDGNAVVVSTHNISDFARYVDRVTVMHDGSLLLDRPRAEIDLEGASSLQEYYVNLVLRQENIQRETND